jgi:uncharacterized protein
LLPCYFKPDRAILSALKIGEEPLFILRFSSLGAHHNVGKTGITAELALRIIERLSLHGRVYITSERPLEQELEPYRIRIKPEDMHHTLAFATLYIGDSQTMTAEAAVMGTPALRFNDFVGKLGYLEELEHRYGLTYGVPTDQPELLLKKIDELLAMPNLKAEWERRRQKMLADKIDVTAFMVWFLENYPASARMMREEPEFQNKFR